MRDVCLHLLVGLQKDFEAWKSLFWSTLIGGYKPKRKKKMARKKKEKCSGEGKICSCKTDENVEKVFIAYKTVDFGVICSIFRMANIN